MNSTSKCEVTGLGWFQWIIGVMRIESKRYGITETRLIICWCSCIKHNELWTSVLAYSCKNQTYWITEFAIHYVLYKLQGPDSSQQSPFIIIVSECKQEAEHLMLLWRKPMLMIWDLIITDLSTEACFKTLWLLMASGYLKDIWLCRILPHYCTGHLRVIFTSLHF